MKTTLVLASLLSVVAVALTDYGSAVLSYKRNSTVLAESSGPSPGSHDTALAESSRPSPGTHDSATV